MKYLVLFGLMAVLAVLFGLLSFINRKTPAPEGCRTPECAGCSNYMCAHRSSRITEKRGDE